MFHQHLTLSAAAAACCSTLACLINNQKFLDDVIVGKEGSWGAGGLFAACFTQILVTVTITTANHPSLVVCKQMNENE